MSKTVFIKYDVEYSDELLGGGDLPLGRTSNQLARELRNALDEINTLNDLNRRFKDKLERKYDNCQMQMQQMAKAQQRLKLKLAETKIGLLKFKADYERLANSCVDKSEQ